MTDRVSEKIEKGELIIIFDIAREKCYIWRNEVIALVIVSDTDDTLQGTTHDTPHV